MGPSIRARVSKDQLWIRTGGPQSVDVSSEQWLLGWRVGTETMDAMARIARSHKERDRSEKQSAVSADGQARDTFGCYPVPLFTPTPQPGQHDASAREACVMSIAVECSPSTSLSTVSLYTSRPTLVTSATMSCASGTSYPAWHKEVAFGTTNCHQWVWSYWSLNVPNCLGSTRKRLRDRCHQRPTWCPHGRVAPRVRFELWPFSR